MKQLQLVLLIVLLLVVGVGVPTVQAHVALDAASMAQLGLHEGDIVGSTSSSDPDVFIVNAYGYKRLFLSPAIFGFYGHLRFTNIKRFLDTVITSMPVSGLFRNCEAEDQRVYGLEVTGEDQAVLRWVNVTGQQAVAEDPDFFKKVFCINAREFAFYTKGTPFASFSQVPSYERTTPPPDRNATGIPLTIPDGFRIAPFTSKIGPLRFMVFSPDGILFASMPSAAGLYGGSGISDGKVFALPDRNGDGTADEVKTVLSGLHLPHGLAFHDGYLYVAEEGTVSRYSYANGGVLGARQVIVSDLPTGGEHLSRTITFSPAGKMYVSVGSACNSCTTGKAGTASIWEFNADGTGGRIFARGMRNAVGLAFQPTTKDLWATENGRDFLGDNLPPDEINIITDGGDYGWPYCYGARIKDSANPNYDCMKTQPSVYDTQAHSAPLGLAFVRGEQFAQWSGDLIVARHGSWNRTQPVGYDVVRLDVEGNKIVGEHPFITGWLNSKNEKLGRPVDVIFGPDGALYLSDDMTNVIYKVSKTP